jgi:hypothetical protein
MPQRQRDEAQRWYWAFYRTVKPGPLTLEKYKPGVPKTMLLLIAGVMWIGIGSLGRSYRVVAGKIPCQYHH